MTSPRVLTEADFEAWVKVYVARATTFRPVAGYQHALYMVWVAEALMRGDRIADSRPQGDATTEAA